MNPIVVNTSDEMTMSPRFFTGPGMVMCAVEDENKVFFTGVSTTSTFTKSISDIENRVSLRMLIEAVNNRTRERNYFRKYSELLEGVITDEEFDLEIDKNEDEYVVSSHIKPSKEDLRIALKLAEDIKDVENTEDLASLFSFDSTIIDRLTLSK